MSAERRVGRLAAPVRLDVWLVESGLARTRSQAKRLVDAGGALVDGVAEKAGHVVRGGETIALVPLPEPPTAPEPEAIPLRVLHQDEWMVAIDKPAGLVVHPAPGAWTGTLVNALLHHGLVERAGDATRPGIVHRLDKETSGVMVVARTAAAHALLVDAFRDRKVHKTYLALVLGRPGADGGVASWPIGRHPHERQRMSTRSPRGREARTRWSVLERFEQVSFVRAEPETGRTHQIRVHLAALGHPVLADPVYGGGDGRALPIAGPGRDLGRQALHAAELRLRHPFTGKEMCFESKLPEDLAAALESLRAATR